MAVRARVAVWVAALARSRDAVRTMSRENAELVHPLQQAWNRRDLEALASWAIPMQSTQIPQRAGAGTKARRDELALWCKRAVGAAA